MNNISKQTYFWELLQKHKITIPIIQRDYAQGRRGKEDLRRNFLNELHTALTTDQKELTLHFVYGAERDGAIQPLDGQQRLTTLWLLHWYYCFLGTENDRKEKIDVLKIFSYETRTSSKEFLEKMCDALHDQNFSYKSYNELKKKDGYTIANYIQDQTWFYAGWTQDPTIQAILRMLSGTFTKGNYKDANGNKDGIEQVFGGDVNSLQKLFDDNCPIKFFYLDMVGIQQTDDLYVKMNARGEQLTSFENFKADLIDALCKESGFEDYVDLQDQKGKCILKKLDSSWSDLFWSNCRKIQFPKQDEYKKQEVDKIDEAYFIFIKRFVLNEYLCCKNSKGKVSLKNLKDEEKEVLEFLIDGENAEYTDFKEYKKLLIESKCIVPLVKTLDAVADKNKFKILADCIEKIPLLKNKKYSYLPVYQYEEKTKASRVIGISEQFRIMNYGIDRYLAAFTEFSETGLMHWLRVLANLVYAIEVPNKPEYLRRLAFVKKVADKAFEGTNTDIYKVSLEGVLTSLSEDNARKQLEEEKDKIEKINNNISLENTLMKLESLWIFEGNINCLLKDELLGWNGLYDFLKNTIDKGYNNTKENEGLRKLLKGILCYYTVNEPSIVMNDKHNGFRRLFNGDFKEALRNLLESISNGRKIDDIISKYNGTGWQKALIDDQHDKDTWNWSNTWKVDTVNETVYLYKGTYHINENIKNLVDLQNIQP